jgi:hypothetical protein
MGILEIMEKKREAYGWESEVEERDNAKGIIKFVMQAHDPHCVHRVEKGDAPAIEPING